MTQRQALPAGWVQTTLGEVATPRGQKVTPSSRTTLKFIGMDCLEPNALKPHFFYEFSSFKSPAAYFEEGDVLYGRMRPYLNKVYKADFEGTCSAEFIVFRQSPYLESDFLKYLLHHRSFVNFASRNSSGDRPRVDFKGDLQGYPVWLPPLLEQQRIVSKIEELFSDLDAGEASLRTVQKLLATYRQSVLKAAVTGELTRNWREANHHRLEPGEALLQRILEARREQWQGRGKYQEPQGPDIKGLPELPEGWVWVTLDHLIKNLITGPFGSALHKEDYVTNGVPLVNPINIKDGRIVPDLEVTVGADVYQRLSRYSLEGGDVIMGRRGEMGRCAPVSENEKGWLCGTGSLIIRLARLVSAEYLAVVISSDMGRQHLERNCVGTTMKNLNQDALLSMPVPVPSLEEQEEILVKREEVRVQTETIAAWCATELKRSGTLRQAILKAAFSGQLVPQDPIDEPASVLLERIRAEREAQGRVAPARRGRRRKAEEAPDDAETVQEALW